MAKAFFISVAKLKELSIINENVDAKLITPTIHVVQDLHLQAVLGTPMYEDFKVKITAGTLTSEEKTLIVDFMYDILVHFVLMRLCTPMKYKFMNKGLMVKNGENSSAIEIGELRAAADEWRSIAEDYAEILTKYLKKNQTTWTKYTEYTEEGMTPNESNYTTGIFLDGMEEDEC